MQKPEIPKNEIDRLRDLKSLGILDTQAEERFDRLTRLASRLFAVPIALVSLVDANRQWFKSSFGLAAREMPRNVSFCGHAILEDDIFVVDDTAADERFADNPLVTRNPKIRFYAGCPLTSLNGHKLGTICLIDREPREFSEEGRALLKDLAAMVEREIELTRMAITDELTGIPNGKGFEFLAEKSLNLCRRKQLPASVVYLYIDKFKAINDKHGRAEGDRALKIVANNMKSVSRDSDIIARLGGDEFAIMFLDASKETAAFVVKRFESDFKSLCRQEALPYRINLTYGIVGYNPDRHASILDLLKEGDRLMQLQKQRRSA
jgi:diguanylate cyclase (GGDEF)-like protein